MTPGAGVAAPDVARDLAGGLSENLDGEDGVPSGFSVTLTNFAGPFDLLLSLIARRQLDITEVALAEVTDEFIAYVGTLRHDAGTGPDPELGPGGTMGQRGRPDLAALDASSAFLVVAATLLDLKTARLLPAGTTDAEEDVALLEARDLLFARLLQYKAFRDISTLLGEKMRAEARRFPRQTTLDPRFASLLPELVWTLSPEQFGALAEDVLARTPKPAEQVSLEHLHAPPVSVREQAGLLAARLREAGRLAFRELVSDAGSTLVIVARFLALLEMFRDRAVTFDQEVPLGELLVRWDPDAPDERPDDGPEGDEEWS
ncbi:segregation/condensation protein A [Citricoccus zhacaiensis]|uniref:Segregation and condensation protein A n=1 Tax=Citricoccus zhacaiensis TaxID=489142 RepID=A0ABQ2M5C1_9MICC|nr:segregation/condensation protein A [Citricoccus zhacaiensis]